MSAVSTFAERLEFGRVRHHAMGTWREDQEIAADVGVKPSSFNEIKRRDEAPSASRTLALARAIGVDPGWLAFGQDSQAPAPEGFDAWLANRRAREAPQLHVAERVVVPRGIDPAIVRDERQGKKTAKKRRRAGDAR